MKKGIKYFIVLALFGGVLYAFKVYNDKKEIKLDVKQPVIKKAVLTNVKTEAKANYEGNV